MAKSRTLTYSKYLLIGLIGVSIFLLTLLAKLPESKIQNLITAHIRIAAQEQGFLFSAEKITTSIIFGPAVKIYNAEFKSIDDESKKLNIPFIQLKPHLTSIFLQTKKASIAIELLGGEISGVVGAGPTRTLADIKLNDIDPSQSQLLTNYLPIKTKGSISGSFLYDALPQNPIESNLEVDLEIENLELPAQEVAGVQLPLIKIGGAAIEGKSSDGKFEVSKFQVGSPNNSDIEANATGSIKLAASLLDSTSDIKMSFRLSDSLIKAFPLIDALIAPAKRSDGRYAYKLVGPLSFPSPIPDGSSNSQ